MNGKAEKTVGVIARFIFFLEEYFCTIGLISCIILTWISPEIIDIGKYYLTAWLGIPFFYICRQLVKIKNQVSLNTSILLNKR